MIILGLCAVDGGGRLDPQAAIFGLLADDVDDDVGDIEGEGDGAGGVDSADFYCKTRYLDSQIGKMP